MLVVVERPWWSVYVLNTALDPRGTREGGRATLSQPDRGKRRSICTTRKNSRIGTFRWYRAFCIAACLKFGGESEVEPCDNIDTCRTKKLVGYKYSPGPGWPGTKFQENRRKGEKIREIIRARSHVSSFRLTAR